MSRRLRAIAQETVAALDRGSYRTGQGGQVAIAAEVARAVAGTRLLLPDAPLRTPEPLPEPPAIEVTGESSLAACRRLDGDRACLVFASARNPGGGFLNGAQAQEESIARASALYPCLRAAWDFYLAHRADPDLGYSDRVVYSPQVPVFRDDAGVPLAAPYPVSFLTSAAPNLSAMRRNQPDRVADVPALLRRRAARILAVAAGHGHRQLVLGAWGCGVFGNDPATVATAFAEALRESPWFERVVFAVLDRGRGEPTRTAFRRVFDRTGVGEST
ncbi:TIGR02452 family protein [Plantactinospora sp. BC1]|uniref:TIGR02452 family protein n=1 Tax=Plantactinospora sp. BC1 TaxID=2108470 RepID=UPI000D166150|nr:TIGR02452 family protein [Plantactinospora sp. BC1]AVT31452.1 TIGR02452 family protein [Plantactinospora sp. BC1]